MNKKMRGMVEKGIDEWYVREKEEMMNVRRINLPLLYYLPLQNLIRRNYYPLLTIFLKTEGMKERVKNEYDITYLYKMKEW